MPVKRRGKAKKPEIVCPESSNCTAESDPALAAAIYDSMIHMLVGKGLLTVEEGAKCASALRRKPSYDISS